MELAQIEILSWAISDLQLSNGEAVAGVVKSHTQISDSEARRCTYMVRSGEPIEEDVAQGDPIREGGRSRRSNGVIIGELQPALGTSKRTNVKSFPWSGGTIDRYEGGG